MRTLPYRTFDNVIEGAVITFVDITEMVRMREALRLANEEMLALEVQKNVMHKDQISRGILWNAETCQSSTRQIT
jgi:hypothetical protein